MMVRQEEDLDPDCLVATGVRAEDGPIRMMALRKYGPIALSKREMAPDLGLVEARGGRRHLRGRPEALGRLRVDEGVLLTASTSDT